MYKDKEAKAKWIDPVKRAELQDRDRVRQAYYAQLEREKLGITEEPGKTKRKKAKE